MSDTASAQDQKGKQKRFRSPAYPAIPLQKAVERATQLHKKTLHHAAPASVLADAWDYGAKSSGLFATIAALKQFGLLVDEGSGHKRRFSLTDRAIRIERDPDSNSPKRREALRQAALAPKIHKELWEKYDVAGASGSMDMALKSHLTLDRTDEGEAPYSDNAADELISEYKSTLIFAAIVDSGIISETGREPKDTNNLHGGLEKGKRFGGAKVGDFIQWVQDGVLKLEQPARVRHVLDQDGSEWVFIDGSETGILMAETVVDQVSGDAANKRDRATPPILPEEPTGEAEAGTRKEITSLDEGNAILTWPEQLSEESFEDFETWLEGVLRKAARRAGVKRDQKTDPD